MRENNRAENSHLMVRRRERKQQKFKSQGSAQPVDRDAIRIAQIRFDDTRCWSANGTDSACTVSAERCPVGEGAISVVSGKGPTIAAGCTGCGVCVHYCPAKPPPLIQLPLTL